MGLTDDPAPPPPLSIYKTQVSVASGPWLAGLDFGLGFAWDPSKSIPQPVVQLAGQDISGYVAMSVDDNRCLNVAIDLTFVQDLICASTPQLYLKAKASISADGVSFTGQVTQLCSGPVAYAWQGSCGLLGARWLVNMWSWTVVTESLRRGAPKAGLPSTT